MCHTDETSVIDKTTIFDSITKGQMLGLPPIHVFIHDKIVDYIEICVHGQNVRRAYDFGIKRGAIVSSPDPPHGCNISISLLDNCHIKPGILYSFF
jgi:hypothetical protein